ncbi:hypothetical protein [Mycolicibacterium alvei]|uniref:Uncharacterized protein n=1 Tax=Mycolicibacterium alvei TaxID=67081 RepID=A0A6N4UUA4_9MYCO|nr:hypothetical protein [Mycolicibacterium alvei]BBX27423.1 hypothetical protein MALV_25480 [Mycolicibacterium alvei]
MRSADRDTATDAALTEIDEAVAHIAAEDAFTALNEAVDILSVSIETSRKTVDDTDDTGRDGSEAPITLLEAAEYVRDSWEPVRVATTSVEN